MGGFGLAVPVGASVPPHLSACRVGDVSLTTQQPTMLPLGSFGTLRSSAFDSHRQQQQQLHHNLIVTSSSSPASNANSAVDDGTYYTVSDNALTEHLLPPAQRDDNRPPLMTSSSLSATLRSVALTASRRGRSDAVGSNGSRLRSHGAGVGKTTEKWHGTVSDPSTATGKNAATAAEWQTMAGNEHCATQELSRLQLNLIEKLGYGTFGEVKLQLCAID